MWAIKNFVSLLPLVFYILAALSDANSLPKCGLGRFSIDGKCRFCPRGTYQNLTTASACVPCPRGTYNSYLGAHGIDVCQQCPPGTFVNKIGATSLRECMKCPSGTASPPGSYACISCPKHQQMALCPLDYDSLPGTCAFFYNFNLIKGFTEPRLICRPCFRGYRLAEDGYTCEECFSPLVVDKVSQTCVKCPPGSGHDYSTRTCLPCTGFKFHDGSSGMCRKCPKGMVGNAEKRATSCVPCPRGTFSRRGRCEPCKKGENTFVRGASDCRPDNLPCASNFFRAFNGVCKRCSRMERLDSKTRRCVPCAKNQASLGGLAKICSNCREGAVGTSEGCQCSKGWELKKGKCRKCRPGTVKDSVHDENQCQVCSRGDFAPRAGMKECLPCPDGSVQPDEGQPRCIRLKCGKGLYPSNRLRDVLPQFGCNKFETNCPPNSKRIFAFDTGLLIHCNPLSCPAGSIKTKSNIDDFRLTQCFKCPNEKPVLDATRKRCIGCRRKEFNAGGKDSLKCKRCGQGFYADTNRCFCGTGRRIVEGKCVACPEGTYGTLDGECLPCAPGTFNDRRGSSVCQNCKAGEVSVAGSRKCKPCSRGTTTYGEGEANCVGPVL